jgi:hypothetical protein
MSMEDGLEATYDGELEGDTYTVVVFATETRGVPRGKRQVRLRIRYRGRTEDVVKMVPRSFTEPLVHRAARQLIAERWST